MLATKQPWLVDAVDTETVAPGTMARLMVAILTDGLGRAVRIPVIVARGRKPGPTFGITSALHGNELNGVPVIHRLMSTLDLRRLNGTIVATVVANVIGFDRRQREFSDGTDLNHVMPGKEHGNAAEIYGHRLFSRIGVATFDYLVDLHTASFGRVNSLYVRADMSHAICAEMAYLQKPQIVVHNPASDHTLRGAAMDHGVPAITVEIGNPQRFQPNYIRSTLMGLRAILRFAEMIPKRQKSESKRPAPFICSRSFWLRTDHGGLLEVLVDLTKRVEKGQLIARQANAFGDVTREYHAPMDGVVVGKSVDPMARTGDRILHLGVPAGELDAVKLVPTAREMIAQQKVPPLPDHGDSELSAMAPPNTGSADRRDSDTQEGVER
jgi:predicted deacylase